MILQQGFGNLTIFNFGVFYAKRLGFVSNQTWDFVHLMRSALDSIPLIFDVELRFNF